MRAQRAHDQLAGAGERLRLGVAARLANAQRRSERLELRLQLLDPRLVLQRGYALLTDPASGHPITSVAQAQPGQPVRAALADGEVDLRVEPPGANRP